MRRTGILYLEGKNLKRSTNNLLSAYYPYDDKKAEIDFEVCKRMLKKSPFCYILKYF